MNKQIIILSLTILLVSTLIYANICEVDYDDEDYLNCLNWRDERISECENDPECVGICDEINKDNCLMISECEPPEICRTPTYIEEKAIEECIAEIITKCEEIEEFYECNHTYYFDNEYVINTTEEKSFMNQICQHIERTYGGKDCKEIIEERIIGESFEERISEACNLEHHISCDCPPICDLLPPVNLTCGKCLCPDNLGRCDSMGLRDFINETNAYCFDGLWFEQKEENESCQNSFECLSNFCSKGICYDISAQVEENTGILNRILSWLSKIFK